MRKTLLVKGRSQCWSFPKGKIEEHLLESSEEAACREVMEETGVDISDLIDADIYLVGCRLQDSTVRLLHFRRKMAELERSCTLSKWGSLLLGVFKVVFVVFPSILSIF